MEYDKEEYDGQERKNFLYGRFVEHGKNRYSFCEILGLFWNEFLNHIQLKYLGLEDRNHTVGVRPIG